MRTNAMDWLLPEDTKRTRDRVEFLREWRAARAKLEKVRRYRIFSNRVLVEVARQDPARREELIAVWGIGEKKADQFGRSLLSALAYFRGGNVVTMAKPKRKRTKSRRGSKAQLQLRIAQ